MNNFTLCTFELLMKQFLTIETVRGVICTVETRKVQYTCMAKNDRNEIKT